MYFSKMHVRIFESAFQFSNKTRFDEHDLPNFGEFVLSCIEADFCEYKLLNIHFVEKISLILDIFQKFSVVIGHPQISF